MLKNFRDYRHDIDPMYQLDYEMVLDLYGTYLKDAVAVGDGMTVCYYTDRNAYTVIARTPCSLTLRRDKAILSPDFKPDFVVGGFAGTVVNQDEQSYTYEEDPDGRVIKAHWSKRKNGWYWDGLHLIAGRHEFYDYNF